MNLIKLHTRHANDIILIKSKYIIAIQSCKDNYDKEYSVVYIRGGYDFKVRETVRDILVKINERDNNNEQM